MMKQVAWGWLAVVCLCSAAFGADEPVVPPKAFVVPEGMEVSLWAASPMFFNPTNIDIDAEGRIWVAEAVNYRGFRNRKKQDRWHEKGDRIVVLTDTTGDGRADRSHVFVQDKDLVAPLGLAVIGNRVVVSCSPNLIVYTDVDGDGRFDPKTDRKEKLLTGFGGHDHDHSLHALVAGPDGRWWFNTGNAGPHVVTDRSGWTLRSSSPYSSARSKSPGKTADFKSDDGRIYVGGLAMSINPDGTGLEVHSHNFRNNFETCLDSFGNVFQNDNDDQVVTCRTTWLMRHANAGYASADGRRTWQADRRPGQSTPAAHWHQDDPGVVPYGDLYGAGSPTGMAVYEGDLFGNKYRGMVMSCEAGRNIVFGYHIEPKGAGLALKRFSLINSGTPDDRNYKWKKRFKDVRKWFRPSDVAVGPDGAIYVSDWFDPVVGGHAMDDRAGTGAIYRIAPAGSAGKKLPIPSIDWQSIDGQVQSLRSAAPNVRAVGFEKLKARGESALSAVEKLLDDSNPFVAARAIWLLAQLGPEGRAKIRKLLKDPDPRRRVAAARALRRAGFQALRLVDLLLDDASDQVRRVAMLMLRDVPVEKAWPYLLRFSEHYRGSDRWYLEAFGTGCDGKENLIAEGLLERVSHLKPSDWDRATADLFWRLHAPAALEPVTHRAMDEELSVELRRQAVDTIAFTIDPAAPKAMARVAGSGPEDLRSYAAWWLSFRKNNDWRSFKTEVVVAEQPTVQGVRLPAVAHFDSGVVKKGRVVQVDVDLTGAKTLYLVVSDAGNGHACEWADWVAPTLHGPNGTAPLTDHKSSLARSGWGSVQVNKTCAGTAMRIGGQPIGSGIGTHAPSVIVYDIAGKGYTRLTARAGLDDGNAKQGGTSHPGCGKTASVVFRVYHDGPTPKQRAAALQKIVLNVERPQADRLEAATAMARTVEGGRMLVTLAQQKKLARELRQAIGPAIFANPDLTVRSVASAYFERPGGSKLPPIDQLTRKAGDAKRGEKLFFGRAACMACHRVGDRGGQVGPDLSGIGGRYDRRVLIDAMLNPSAAIAFGFETTLITKRDGEALSGFLVGDGETVILKDAAGKQHAIDADQITSRRKLNRSLMPSVANLGLEAQQIADLAEYLISLKNTGGATP